MIVLDSCGWLEVFARSAIGEQYRSALEDETQLVVPSVCIYEVGRRMTLERGQDVALRHVAVMSRGRIVGLGRDLAVAAMVLGIQHGLPFADSVIYATAQAHGAEVWTHDEHFRGLPGVRFVEAPAPTD